MERTMKAAVVHAFGKPLTIEEVDVPRPAARDVLVKIEACGVCHTDLDAAEGDWPVKPNLPSIPGHEAVGRVIGVGSADVGHVKEGDRVGIPWLYSACGHCEHCLGGWETLCELQKNTGYSVNGGSRSTRWPIPTKSAISQATWLRRSRTGAVRRRHRVQGPQGGRHQARQPGGHFRHRWIGPHGGAVRQGNGLERGRRGHRRRQTRLGQVFGRERDRQRQRQHQ
jgi:hypothetical protein